MIEKLKQGFRLPVTNRGQRRLEYGIVAAGVAIAMLAVWLQIAAATSCAAHDQLDRLGLLIELVR
jgi:hypothetical protein